MSVKPTIDEISADVDDLLATNFDYTNTTSVPYDNDQGLSYEGGKTKLGKIIETCVLYVDIRNSVQLNKNHTGLTMGKLYTAFIKSVIKAGRHHSGHTRNIIGDRVMIIFDTKNCYTNAVNCAISINHIAQKIINTKFKTVEFKCGIGIDQGSMKVIKVGVPRKGSAANANRGLVWAGKTANLASRLTDMGNKTITETYYEVTRMPYNHYDHNPIYSALSLSPFSQTKPNPLAPLYLKQETVNKSEDDFIDGMYMSGGEMYWHGDKVVHFEKKSREMIFKPILITERVLKGLKAEALDSHLHQPAFWKEQPSIKDVDVKIYGGDLNWIL
jgi:class 3 adenylate cyclase